MAVRADDGQPPSLTNMGSSGAVVQAEQWFKVEDGHYSHSSVLRDVSPVKETVSMENFRLHVDGKLGRGADKGGIESPRPYKCLLIFLDGSPKMAPLYNHAIILIVRKGTETRDVQIKISGTALLKSRMDEFVVNNFQTFNSVNTLVDRAVRYVVKRYEAAEGRIDKDGFPLDVAQRIGSSTNVRPKPRRRSAIAPLEREASV